ncbi:MAG TPA: hypothetical protein PKM41_04220 [Deltaproteobacteria bacterium]|nr:hypothetical protein [Deltaproteobacteria bacterium]HOI06120.1 hypothetical protein [Deltaproteobacteria bacterium]
MEKLPFDVAEFDPATSEKLACWPPEEAGALRETESLYKTRTGYFFILSVGGLFSRYVQFPGPEIWFGGIDIRPVTEEEALEWCESTGSYEVIDEQFSDLE